LFFLTDLLRLLILANYIRVFFFDEQIIIGHRITAMHAPIARTFRSALLGRMRERLHAHNRAQSEVLQQQSLRTSWTVVVAVVDGDATVEFVFVFTIIYRWKKW